MPPKRKSVESRSRQVKPKSDINFKWGIEFETHSVIYDENGKDKVPIWEDGKVTITSEMVDIEKNLHPAPFHECKINEKDTTAQGACLFNLESQLGVFNGFSLDEFNEEYDNFVKNYKTFIENKEITINGIPYTIFSFKNFNLQSNDAYIDGKLETPGTYKTDKNDFIGYVKELDTLGVAQMTSTFELQYLPNLFKVIAENIWKDPIYFYFEYVYSVTYNESLEFMKLIGIEQTDPDYLTTFGFIIYMVYYWKVFFEKIVLKEVYFKAKFPVKPRTNPAGLYQNMNQNVKDNLKKLKNILELKQFSEITLTYYTYLYHSLKHLQNPEKVYYIKNLGSVPNNFYLLGKLTEDDLKKMYPNVIIEKDVPFFNYFFDENLNFIFDIGELYLYIDNNNMELRYTGSTEVLEWTASGDNISIEFRLFKELIVLSERIATTKRDKIIAEKLVDVDRLNIDEIKESIQLIFSTFIKKVFGTMDHTKYIEMPSHVSEEFDEKLYDKAYFEKYGVLKDVKSYSDFVNQLIDRFNEFKTALNKPVIVDLLLTPEIKQSFTHQELVDITVNIDKGNFKEEELLTFQNILKNAQLDKETLKSYLDAEKIKQNLELRQKMLYFFPTFEKEEIISEKQEEIFQEVIMFIPIDKLKKIGEFFRINIPTEDLLKEIDKGVDSFRLYIDSFNFLNI